MLELLSSNWFFSQASLIHSIIYLRMIVYISIWFVFWISSFKLIGLMGYLVEISQMISVLLIINILCSSETSLLASFYSPSFIVCSLVLVLSYQISSSRIIKEFTTFQSWRLNYFLKLIRIHFASYFMEIFEIFSPHLNTFKESMFFDIITRSEIFGDGI